MPFIPVAEYGALPRPHIQIEGAVDLSGNGNQGIFPEEKRMHLKYGWEPKVSSIMCVCVWVAACAHRCICLWDDQVAY